MPSLRSIILDNRFAAPLGLDEDEWDFERQNAFIAEYQLKARDTVLVNATDVGYGLFEDPPDGWDEWRRIPCPKPPFHKTWLEMNYHGHRFGCLAQRIDVPPGKAPLEAFARRNVLQAVEWGRRNGKVPEEVEKLLRTAPGETIEAFAQTYDSDWGRALDLTSLRDTRPFGEFPAEADSIVSAAIWDEAHEQLAAGRLAAAFWFLDKQGDCIAHYMSPWPSHGENMPPKALLGAILLWAMHTFARMNCHNVKVLPMKAGAPSAKQLKKHGPPATVWHEIVVTSLPELRRARGECPPDGEKRELRFHRVRGHYADYTKGKGLFGKLKIRIYVDEHEAGNAELGRVASGYRVK